MRSFCFGFLVLIKHLMDRPKSALIRTLLCKPELMNDPYFQKASDTKCSDKDHFLSTPVTPIYSTNDRNLLLLNKFYTSHSHCISQQPRFHRSSSKIRPHFLLIRLLLCTSLRRAKLLTPYPIPVTSDSLPISCYLILCT